MTAFTPAESRQYFKAKYPGLRNNSRRQVKVKCLFHEDRTASMSVDLERGVWKCHACNIGGGILDLERQLTGQPDSDCWKAINATIGKEDRKPVKPKRQIINIYDYRNASGQVSFQAVRYEPKGFSQRRPDGKGGWIDNMDGVTRVPYHLVSVIWSNIIIIVEGEKDAENVQKAAAGFPNNDGNAKYAVTTNIGGAGKWQDSYSVYLRDKTVFIFGDNDDAGRKHAQQVFASVSKHTSDVYIVDLPGLAEKGDVSEYLETHTPLDLFARMQAAQAPPMDQQDVRRLTGELLAKCLEWIPRFIVVGMDEIIIMAFWILHTWVFSAAVCTPYLYIWSAEKQCGKSNLLRVLKLLVLTPRFSSSISASALARVVVKFKPTLFLDEIDALVKGDPERAQDIRGVLNGGFEIDGTYTRCVGKDFDVVDYPTFCPKALAGIGALWDTVEDRSIKIELKRKRPSDRVESCRSRKTGAEAAPINDALKKWANGGVVKLLEQIVPDDIPGLNGRQMDISEPLLQIAQLAGGDWPQKLAGALKRIFNVSSMEDGSTGTTLLRDIRSIFDARAKPLEDTNAQRIFSRDLADALCSLEGHQWQEWARGQGLTPNRLALQLRHFRIYSKTIDIGGESLKGYEFKDFDDAWSRYIPIQNVEASEPALPKDETSFSKRRTEEAPTFQKPTLPRAGIGVRRSDVSKPGKHEPENPEVRV